MSHSLEGFILARFTAADFVGFPRKQGVGDHTSERFAAHELASEFVRGPLLAHIEQPAVNLTRYKVAHKIAGEHYPLGIVYTSREEAQRWADHCNARSPQREAIVVPWDGDDSD